MHNQPHLLYRLIFALSCLKAPENLVSTPVFYSTTVNTTIYINVWKKTSLGIIVKSLTPNSNNLLLQDCVGVVLSRLISNNVTNPQLLSSDFYPNVAKS